MPLKLPNDPVTLGPFIAMAASLLFAGVVIGAIGAGVLAGGIYLVWRLV